MTGHASRPSGSSSHHRSDSHRHSVSVIDEVRQPSEAQLPGAASNPGSLHHAGDRSTPISPRHGDLPPLHTPRTRNTLDSLNSPPASSVYSTPLDVPSINCATASSTTPGGCPPQGVATSATPAVAVLC